MILAPLLATLLFHPPAGKLPPLSAETKTLIQRALKTQAEADQLAARRALAKEGRYSCCITGGCVECLKEAACNCGPALLATEGVCAECVAGWKGGAGKFEGILAREVRLERMSMSGSLGDWKMNREGTGTGWQPDGSPMFARMTGARGWSVMTSHTGYGVATHQTKGSAYTSGFGMAMAWKATETSRVGARLMLSADPILLGRGGYPLRFQEGEGLTNRQHPHDFVKELALTGARKLSPDIWMSAYLAAVGEPAFGPTAYVHRPSALDNPEAPLGHHAFDSTHITPGVVTLALSRKNIKLDASLMNSREPDNERFSLDGIRLDARTIRLTMNPSESASVQISHAELKAHRRSSATLMQAHRDWHLTLGWADSERDFYLVEAAYLRDNEALFTRLESVPRPEGRVEKLTLGATRSLGGELAVGASLSVYGRRSGPTGNIFLRVRTGRM